MKRRIYAYIIGFVLLIVGIFFDKQISIFIVGNRINFLNSFMIWVSFFGTGFFVFIFMTTLFLWQERKRDWIVPLWISFILSMLMVFIIKQLVFRIRPFNALGILNLVEAMDSSFPSGHTVAVFSTLAILDKEFPRFKWFWIVFACMVAFSRIYLGVHYLSDVVFSALLGGTISLFIVKYHKFFRFEKTEIKEKEKRKIKKKRKEK